MNAARDDTAFAPETPVIYSGHANADQRLARLDRLYRALNTTLEAIMRARSPDELYRSVCDASVHGAEFVAATVFLREAGDASLKGVASTGPQSHVAIGLRLSTDESVPEGRGMIGTAYRLRKPCVSNDMLADERLRNWWHVCRATGANAVAALPLMQGEQTIGVLVYYSRIVGEFDDEMVGQLERVGENVSFALGNFELDAQRQRAEAATLRASRMYAALSASNEAITRTHSPRELFQQVCKAAVDGGKLSIAAVLLHDESARRLTVAAASGAAVGLEQLYRAFISVDETLPQGQGPAGIAFRSAQTHTCSDFQNDERTRPWRAAARAAGARSNAAVPLMQHGRPIGVLLFYSEEKDAFDADIVKLLERLSENLSYALETFEREAERKAAQQRIQHMATHDALTGLPNRVMFTELLSLALHSGRRYGRNFAVLFIDLDRFKLINDSLGHEAGDSLLKEIAARFKRVLRESDVVARLGGDEFIVLLPEVGAPEQIAVVARKLLAAAAEPMTLCGQRREVSASIGIAVYPEGGADEQALMKNADSAMYLAKEQGKNNLRFYGAEIQP